MIFNKYPYTDFHDLNLDWIIKIVQEVVDHIKTIDNNIQIDVETILTQWLEDGTILNLINGSVLTPVINQVESIPGRESIADKHIPVLDDNGLLFGSAINLIDLMIKPRLPAENSIPVFDHNGNLTPMCLDSDNPVLTSDMLLLNTMTSLVLMVNDFSDTLDGDSGITFKNGFKIMYGYITIPAGAFTADGNVFRKITNVTHSFYKPFSRIPKIILGNPTDMNNPIWCSGCVASTSGITRIMSYATSNYSSITPTISYIAVGY